MGYEKFQVKGSAEFSFIEESKSDLHLYAESDGKFLKIFLIDMSVLYEDEDAEVEFIPVESTTLEREYSDEELEEYIDRFQVVKTKYEQNRNVNK